MNKIFAAALGVIFCLARAGYTDDTTEVTGDIEGAGTRWVVSPLVGMDHNELKVRGPGGRVSTETDTAPEYGLFLLMAHPNLVVSDFLFWTDVNHTDVFGNLIFINAYGGGGGLTWNVGAGHLYHKIDPVNEEITVTVPMLKAGPLWRIAQWKLMLNPYVGYAWERVDTQHGDQDNDSYLYGLTAGWRWRMLGATINYYYQDSREADEDYQTLRARLTCGFTKHWGGVVRFDYMEHSTSDDTSVLTGPTYSF